MEKSPFPVTLVLAPLFPLLSLAACTESLRLANRELGTTAFTRTIATVDGETVYSSSGVPVAAEAALGDITFSSLVIVLSSYEPEAACTPGLLNWLRRQDRQGATIGCVDTGGYLLAHAGLLRDRHIAVHHETLPAYREVLGEAVTIDRLYTSEGGLPSSAGGMATLDMMLSLIARFHGEALADRIAHILNYSRLPETAQAAHASGDGAIARMDRRLGRMVELMQAHLEAPLPLDTLCRMAHLHPATARRQFLKQFGETPGRYYTGLRLARARSLLSNSALSVGEIAALAGFEDASAFARAYRQRYGVLPSKARHAPTGW